MATIKYKDPTSGQWVEIPTGGGSSVTVDSALSSTSENPVQNKVINSALGGKYTKPADGIPKKDLEIAVQTSLGKADSALQSVPSNYVTNTTLAAETKYGVAKIWLDTTDNYLHIRTDGQ